MAESRERVIEAAGRLFLGGSFHKIGIAEICAVAQVNKGTFYHFFPSKLDLLLEVIDQYVEQCGNDFTAVADGDGPAGAKLKRLFSVPRGRNQAWKEEHGVTAGCFVGNIILEMAANEPVVRQRAERAISELTVKLRPVVRDYLNEVQAAGSDEDVNAVADVLMTLIQGAQVQVKARNDPAIFDRYAELAPFVIDSYCAGKGNNLKD